MANISTIRTLGQQASEGLTRVATTSPHVQTAKLFRISIVSFMLLNALLKLPHVQEFYAPTSYLYRYGVDHSSLIGYMISFIQEPMVIQYYWAFVVGEFVFLLLALFGIAIRLSLVLVYITSENLKTLIPVALDGGDNLISLLLVYLIVMDTSGHKPDTSLRGLTNNALTNVAVTVSRLQIMFVYLVAGLLKVQGDLWSHGMAIYYVLQSDYSFGMARTLVRDYVFIAMFASYAVIAYQLVFPYLVWFRQTRPWVLLVGVGFHMGIFVFMGLLEFSLVMCASYTIFFYDEWCATVLKALRRGQQFILSVPSKILAQ